MRRVTPAPVAHRTTQIDGVEVFFREVGPPEAPVVLLPHGYPCSSFEFRHFMAALGDRWRLVAPDYPASATAELRREPTSPTPSTPTRTSWRASSTSSRSRLRRLPARLRLAVRAPAGPSRS